MKKNMKAFGGMLAVLGVVLLTSIQPGFAATIVVSENQSISSGSPDKNYGDDTSGGGLLVGKSDDDGFFRFYIKFDLPAYTPGTYISSAFLTGFYNGTQPDEVYSLLSYHRVTNDAWSSDTLTWNNQPGYETSPLAVFSAYESPPGRLGWFVEGLVNQEYQGDGQLSLMFKLYRETESAPEVMRYFLKSEYDLSQAFRIEYTISSIPIPGAELLFGSSLLGLTALARRRRSAQRA